MYFYQNNEILIIVKMNFDSHSNELSTQSNYVTLNL